MLLGWRFGPSFTFWKKKKEKEERNGYASKKSWERTESCSFASVICRLLFTFSRQRPFPEISQLPRHALLPLLPPAGCAHCLLTGQIHHPKSVLVRFLLLAAQEGVLFALPNCSRGLMLRCYVQTISAVMNHVLPPLCFYFCTKLFFFFQANTSEFPCLLLKRCTTGTQHRLSYSYRPATAEISKPTSRSKSCRPFFFLQPKVNWFSVAWNNFARHI